MNNGLDSGGATGSETVAAPVGNAGSVVAWIDSSGDSKTGNVVHIDPSGMTWVLYAKATKEFDALIHAINSQPDDAPSLIRAYKKGTGLPREQLARVNYTPGLAQLTLIDIAGKKTQVPNGKNDEHAEIFAAVAEQLGAEQHDEEADVWSAIQSSVIGLAGTAFIGGLLIVAALSADPDAEFTGRRSGTKALANWLGYTVGPVWISVAVAVVALGIAAFMVNRLKNRPRRHVLTFG